MIFVGIVTLRSNVTLLDSFKMIPILGTPTNMKIENLTTHREDMFRLLTVTKIPLLFLHPATEVRRNLISSKSRGLDRSQDMGVASASLVRTLGIHNSGRENSNSRERMSALECLLGPDLCDLLPMRASSNADSGKLQDVQIQYDGVAPEILLTSPVFPLVSSDVHTPDALRFGGSIDTGSSAGAYKMLLWLLASKQAGKRKVTKPPANNALRETLTRTDSQESQCG